MKIKLTTNFLAGAFFAALGLASAAIATQYHIGTAARMGPGYFPILIGLILAVFGGSLIVSSFFSRNDEPVGEIGLRAIVCVILAIVVFGLLIESGLITATIAAIVVASFARPIQSYLEVMLLAVGFAVFAALVFVYGLGLPMRLLPI